ncbi:MAG: ribosome silencing factor [Gammaproteobacteria bacterium]|jgi:ribosome-associated protein|nr:ribosome silencing factor [Gammaproteobacteria bacterium]|tara:strand:- start:51 stop:401 length:351 start_codon:yes stop_codon:yes gene_type:complete
MLNVELKELVVRALEEVKGEEIVCLDISELTDIADFMIVASGNSSRHVKALVNSVVEEAKHAGTKPLGVEGLEQSEWALIDLADVIVHVMLPKVRDFYDLERLWSMKPGQTDENLP